MGGIIFASHSGIRREQLGNPRNARAPARLGAAATATPLCAPAHQMTRFRKIKAQWKESRAAPLGKRFQRLNALRREGLKRRSRCLRIVYIAVAVALLLVAIVLSVMPGPAFIFAIPACTLLAAEFLWAAKILDFCEKTADPLTQRVKRGWSRLSRGQRIAAMASATACSIALIAATILL